MASATQRSTAAAGCPSRTLADSRLSLFPLLFVRLCCCWQSASSFFSVDTLFVPVVWGLLIPVSELAFNWLAERLTAWENWRTASLHSKNKIVKVSNAPQPA
jgi:hypothetical protein